MNEQQTGGKRPATRRSPSVTILALGMVLVAIVIVVFGTSTWRGTGRKEEARPPVGMASRYQARQTSVPQATPGLTEDVAALTSLVAPEKSATTPEMTASAEAAVPRREIIYTGQMALEVDDVGAAADRAEAVARAADGWVSARESKVDTQGRRTSSITLRIPAARFASVHDSLRTLGEVVHDAIRSQDVGMEFVDLEARLRNLEREEKVVSGMFSRGGKIGDVLQVERELARVRGEIESAQGRLRYLQNQVAYSTLTVTLAPTRPAIERRIESWNLGYHVLRAWRALVSLTRMLTYALIYLVIVGGPLALLLWGIWRIARAASRRRPS